jgi:uncharacterized protein YqgC (DUF456 family)
VSGGGLFVIALVMAVGLVGVVIPVLPGLLLIWGAGLAWVLLDGGGAARWAVLVMMTALLGFGSAMKYVLPARAVKEGGAPFTTMLAGAVGAVIGFFAIPVVGLFVGGIAGIFLAELLRLGDAVRAYRSTRAALLAIGLGILIELLAGVGMVLVWIAGEIAT